MISKDYLKEVSKNTGLHLYQQEKDYLLKLFLYFYYKRFGNVVFKGGTCLKYLLNLNRFSEDLDFELTISPDDFKNQVSKVLKDIESIGIKNYYLKSEKFEKAYTCEIAFKGPLYSGSKQTRNKFRIDAGKRLGLVKTPKWKFVKSEYPETKNKFLVYLMDPDEILIEKVITLLERNKGRDLYDVWFIFSSGYKLDKDLLSMKYDKKIDLSKIVNKEEYERDLRRLVNKIVPYQQVKKEVREELSSLVK